MVSILGFLILQAAAVSCYAVMEWVIAEEVSLGVAPLDIAVASDGQLLFVLVPNEVLLYSMPDKKVETRIPLDEPFDRLTYAANENALILTSKSGKNMRVITLEAVHEIMTSGLPIKGPANAPVTIAVFHDYQCPYCIQLVPTLERILNTYPESVNLVYKNFPLKMHRFARNAASAALAADKQGKFWDFHAALMENYRSIDEQKIRDIATELELDLEKFTQDLNDPEIQKIIARDLNNGVRAGVRGTPTVFVNGKLLQVRSYEGLTAKIEHELKKNEKAATTDAADSAGDGKALPE